MLLEETFTAHGHRNIRATHQKTFEVTREPSLTTRGDCIAAVSAEQGLREMPQEMREAAKNPATIISLKIKIGDTAFTTTGRGDPELTWDHPTDMVARMSDYVCPRTIMVHADKATIHMPRTLVQLLRDPKAVVTVIVSVKLP